MWKQQDSLEAPAATVAETPGSPEDNAKDGNPLLERLRALEVEWTRVRWPALYCLTSANLLIILLKKSKS